jgi:preprotein translocase subunit SecB
MSEENAKDTWSEPGDTDASHLSPEISIEAQYIKDLSFENPIAPRAPADKSAPEINVEVTTGARPIGDGFHETTLLIRAEATSGGSPLFILELTYGSVMKVSGIPDEAINAVLLTEGARLIFPFARNIIADVTRDGGFPPLFLQPIDFIDLYNNQQSRSAH